MNILVTGGAGFIGANFVEHLNNKGHENITIIDNLSTGNKKNIEGLRYSKFVEADLSNIGDWVAFARHCDVVVHFAALADIVPSIENPLDYYNSNVTATINLLEAIKENRNLQKFIYSASSSCYGLTESLPTKEVTPVRPEYPYAMTKLMGEQLALHYRKVYQLPIVSLRYFNVYGPKSRTNGTYGAMFGTFLAQYLANKPLTIVGDGSQKRDFIYVSDVCDAIYTAVTKQCSSEVYNVGTGQSVSVKYIADLISENNVCIPQRPGEPFETLADINRISSELGWSAKINIVDGISKLKKNLDYWREAPVWTPETIDLATKDWFKYLGRNK